VDFTVIVTDGRTIKTVKKFQKACRKICPSRVHIGGLPIRDLKIGRRSKGHANPSRIIKHIPHYKLIYGKRLDLSKFKVRTHKADLKTFTKVFRTWFIPSFKKKEKGVKGEFRFFELVKQTFWLVELDIREKKGKSPNDWRELDRTIKDKNHIIHDAWRYRNKPTKDKKKRKAYVKKLEKYVKNIEKRLK
jgi:hypothetical protein